VFSPGQLEILQAVVNRMIPPDDWPGGWEAGVGDYLSRQFERDLKGVVGLYQQGLDALEAEAQAAHGAGFAQLGADQQDTLLMQAERGTVQADWPIDPPTFIMMLAHHCAEGFYSDPGNGGNRDEIAWRMIGFEVRG
jgi:hypothetical protein